MVKPYYDVTTGKPVYEATTGKPATCGCDANCIGGTQTDMIELVVAGIGNLSPTDCTFCPDLDQRYLIERIPGDACAYEGFATTSCGEVFINLDFANGQANGGFALDSGGGLIPMFGFLINLTSPYDCSANRTLTITSPQTTTCDFTNVTASYEPV